MKQAQQEQATMRKIEPIIISLWAEAEFDPWIFPSFDDPFPIIGPLYSVITIAPENETIVPTTLAILLISFKLTTSSLQQ